MSGTDTSSPQFIVVFDDEQGICVPMVWDDDCEGALCGFGGKHQRVALFTNRVAAKKAIRISTRFALLCQSQGKPANDDFLGANRKWLRVVKCQHQPTP